MSINALPFKQDLENMGVLKGLFQKHKVSLCRGFVLQRKAVMGEGMLQLPPLKESHIFLNERPFATRLQSCCSEKDVCPLASDISYRQASEGKEREQMRKKHIDNLFLTPCSAPHLFFLIWTLYASVLILFLRPCQRLSARKSIIHAAIHPSRIFAQELAANAKALFPTLNIEGLTKQRRSSFDLSGRSGFS